MFPAEALYVLRSVPGAAGAGLRLCVDQADPGADRAPAEEPLALSGAVADYRRADAPAFIPGFTPLVRCSRLAERLGVSESTSRMIPSTIHAVLQGPRGVGRGDARRGWARLECPGLRVDRQPRQQRVGACRPSRAGVLRVHPRQPRGGQGAQVGHLRSDDSRRLPRQLRRRQPAVHAGGGSARLGLREHQPAVLLRRRARRPYGFEIAEQLGWRFPQHVVSPVAGGTLLPRIARGFGELVDRRARRGRSARAFTPRRRPAARRSSRARQRGRDPRSRSAQHDREVDRHRQSGRRPSGARRPCARPAERARP